MTFVKLKNKEFYTASDIDIIDNNLTHVGFIMVQDKETENRIIITTECLVYAEEVR